MNFYTRYIFFCNNIRKDGKACCSQLNAKTMYRYIKDKRRQEGINDIIIEHLINGNVIKRLQID
ncbi:hypothetical protein [Candidatus Ruthia endofausta]|nr:hypothetical protein [Candidatus Ruthia endofausta]